MAVNNSLAKSKQEDSEKIVEYLARGDVKNQINNVLGGSNSVRFIAAVVSAVNNNPTLRECTSKSIVSAALLGETLKLSPSPQLGQYYMVPFNDNKKHVKVAQFQLGYKGYIQLAIRSGQYKKLNVLAIKEGELIRFDPLNEEIEVKLIEDEEERENATTIGYYAMFEYTNGFKKAMYWSKKKMLAHADRYSQAFSKDGCEMNYKDKKTGAWITKKKVSFSDYKAGNYSDEDEWMYSSFWYKDFDGMAYKTMLRQLISKWGIMSIEMQNAIDADMAVINEDGTKTYVDNEHEQEGTEQDDNVIEGEGTEIQPETSSTSPKEEQTGGVQQALFGN